MFQSYPFRKILFSLFAIFIYSQLTAQTLPTSICSPSGGNRADIIDVQVDYRGPSDPAPTFNVPIGAENATLTISSHQSVLTSPSKQVDLSDEDFITMTVNIDFTTNTSSGILNFAQSTEEDSTESNLYTWLDVPFGVNVSSQKAEGQLLPNLLNDLTLSLNSGVLTVTEANNTIYSSYLMEFTKSTSNSMNFTGGRAMIFTGGQVSDNITIPFGTSLVIISKKGTVNPANNTSNGGTEEGYSDGRIVLDLDSNEMTGFMTVANGSNLAYRSTYGIDHQPANSTNSAISDGNVIGDYTSKSTDNTTDVNSVGISEPIITVSGSTLTVTRSTAYANAFDDVYICEFYSRTGSAMSASFIASRSSYIAFGEGSGSGTARDIKVPTGSNFVVIRQAGNANNSDNANNENALAGYYIVDLDAGGAAGFFYQQVGFNGSTRRDDNYGFLNIPLDGTSTRGPLTPPAISGGIYYTPGNPYDLRFTLSPDKTTLTVTNAFGEVPDKYKALLLATFYGKKTDLTATTTNTPTYYNAVNDGSCGGIEFTFTVCNPGSGNSAGGFPIAVYSEDPTSSGSAVLLDTVHFPASIDEGQCETFNFTIDLQQHGITDPNITVYAVLNDDGRNASGGIGTAIGQPFALTDLEGQDDDYIECDYTNNLVPITINNVMACPTVDFLVTNNHQPTITGTFDDANSTGLTVEVNGTTYSSPSQVSSSGNNWSLDLSGQSVTLPSGTYPVTAISSNADGLATDGTVDELIITDAGVVMRDLNGITDGAISGPPIDTVNGVDLYVNIISVATGFVIESSQVQSSGTYVVTPGNFTNDDDYTFQLTINQGTVGISAPTTELSGDFVYIGEGTSGTGDGNADGEFTVTNIDVSNLPAINFGIQRTPTSGGNDIPGVVVNNVVQGTRYNPGVFGDFEMPAAAFGGTDDGNITEVNITDIAIINNDILFMTYDGVDYYRDMLDIPSGCGSCQQFPAGGLFIPTTAAGVLTKPVYLATVESFVDGSLFIQYRVRDNADYYSTNTTELEVPMIALKYENGAWANGSDASGQPDQTDGDKTLFWIDNGGTLSINAEVKNLIIYNGVDAEVDGICLKVNNEVDNRGGKLVLLAQSDEAYGQYYGPAVEASMEMEIEKGWHNVAFPIDMTVADLASQNNTILEPNKVRITGDISNSNLMYYNTEVSGGKEYGFFVDRNGTNFTAHAYGQYLPADNAQNLIDRGWNFYWDEKFVNTLPSKLSVEGTTNDGSKTYSTHNNFGGWTLIPNIYPVALSTQAMYNDGFFTSDFDKAVFIWNPNDAYVEPLPGNTNQGAYIGFDPENGVTINGALSPTTDGDALIAPFQGFYIRRSDASTVRREDVGGGNPSGITPVNSEIPVGQTDPAVTGSSVDVTMKPQYRSSCQATTHYKTGPVADVVLLKVTDVSTGLVDATELAFAGHYTDGIDKSYDIRKFAGGGAQFPVLFSIVENEALVINKMAVPDYTKTVPLGFSSAKAEHQFKIEANHNPESYTLYLEDLKTGAWHNLNTGAYTFKNDVSFDINRFKLHFNNGSRDIEQGSKIMAFHDGEMLNVVFEQLNTPQANVMITDVVGRVLYQKENVATNGALQIPNLKSGEAAVYIVHVSAGSFADAVKVVF